MLKPDLRIENAPSYLIGYVKEATSNGISKLLFDGSFCGHGEINFRIYEIINNQNLIFTVFLPNTNLDESHPNVVKVICVETNHEIIIYDPRQHPASWYSNENLHFENQNFCCKNCNEEHFIISVGFEIPEDSTGVNDVSWFALAAECVNCKFQDIIFEDETA